MARLVYMDAHGHQQVWEIDAGRERIVIGRHPDCDLVAPDLGVSRQHCALVRDDAGGYQIEDLGSHNGTLVNHAPVTQAPLKSHDLVRCAGLVLQFFEDSAYDASMTYPMTDSTAEEAAAVAQAAMHGEIERLRRYNATQAQRLGQVQDEIHEQSQSITAADARIAELEGSLEAAQTLALNSTVEIPATGGEEMPVVRVERTPLAPVGLATPSVVEAEMAARIVGLESELSMARADLANAQAQLQTNALPEPARAGETELMAQQLTEQQNQMATLQSELTAARAGFMASDAEQIARLAVLERELERTDARLGAADLEVERFEDELAGAAEWLSAVGVRYQAQFDDLEALRANLETAKSAAAEARQSARAAGKLRREVRMADGRAAEAEAKVSGAIEQLNALSAAVGSTPDQAPDPAVTEALTALSNVLEGSTSES